MDHVARVFSSVEDADESDEEYYASLSPAERVDILLDLAAQYRRSLGPSAERFERVCRVVELTEG